MKDKSPFYDVAVSVVTFRDKPEEVASLVRSLSASRQSVHITVIDNSETTALRDAAEGSGAEYVHSERNVGFGSGHNLAMRKTLARAKYHAVVNPDISVETDVLQQLYDFMESHPDVGQAMPAICNLDGTEQRLTKRLPTPSDLFLRRFLGSAGKRLAPERYALYEMRDVDMSVSREVPCLSGCFMFLRSSVLQKVGLFDERFFLYMEDVDLCRRVGDAGKTVIVPEAIVTHGYRKGSYKKPRLLAMHLFSAARYFSKWGWFIDSTRKTRNTKCGVLERVESQGMTAAAPVEQMELNGLTLGPARQ